MNFVDFYRFVVNRFIVFEIDFKGIEGEEIYIVGGIQFILRHFQSFFAFSNYWITI